ncbi:VWA domain-containing protein [Flagellimonas sp. DF-77]|uniref:VWA domain-containing protein n=1 Tax=Flagellimonas algarum TaxID=3230298 RepID=UPI0033978131
MQYGTVLLIVLAVLVACTLAYFQYYHKVPKRPYSFVLALLRGLAVFAALVLFIDPKLEKSEYYLEKPELVVLVDNSSSISALGGDSVLVDVLDRIKSDPTLEDRFNQHFYRFDERIEENDSSDFSGRTTDLAAALENLSDLYDSKTTAMVVLTDGNQNLGNDYEYVNMPASVTTLPVVIGDTTRYQDLRIDQVTMNKYSFLGNSFPVEIGLVYSGAKAVETQLSIVWNGRTAFKETVTFSPSNRARTVSTTLRADRVGLQEVRLLATGIPDEQYLANNTRSEFIEVIDEKTDILLVTSFMHPDLGALTKSIESNEQRTVSLLSPKSALERMDGADLVILYQPDNSFGPLYEAISNKGVGKFTITGPRTDWQFLNRIQSAYTKESYTQSENVLADKNEAFSSFDISGFEMIDFPPLETTLGELLITVPYEAVATQIIQGVRLTDPLLLTLGEDRTKEVLLLGENLWKWRLQDYRSNRSFEMFDGFMDQLMRYLGDAGTRNRLELDYENVFQGDGLARINASYFDETFTFKRNASLEIEISGPNGFNTQRPMLLKGYQYEIDLADLPAGEYGFTVTETNDNRKRSGKFSILDFDLEQQFLSADDGKLARFAGRNNGQLYYSDAVGDLVDTLHSDDKYLPVQKSTKNVVSLIDFRIMMFLIVLFLGAEWLIRKYNGLL